MTLFHCKLYFPLGPLLHNITIAYFSVPTRFEFVPRQYHVSWGGGGGFKVVEVKHLQNKTGSDLVLFSWQFKVKLTRINENQELEIITALHLSLDILYVCFKLVPVHRIQQYVGVILLFDFT